MAYDSYQESSNKIIDFKKKTRDDIKTILKEARGLIAERGWGRHTYHCTGSDGEPYNYCMLGAIMDVVLRCDRVWFATSREVHEAILPFVPISPGVKCDDSIGSPRSNIIYFNDFEAIDKEQVLSIFDKAIVSIDH